MPKIPLRVYGDDLANLRESGLTDATIRENGLRTETDSAVIAKTLNIGRGANPCLGALVFPYRDIDGNVNGFARVRPHVPRIRNGKAIKYEQPAGEALRAFLSKRTVELIREGVDVIAITEGEKKAMALAQAGIAAIGISGVWSWKVKGTEELIPDLAEIEWKGRTVYIIFDYDEKPQTRENVHEAMRRLARALRKAGAVEVYDIALPPGPDGEKQGVDDFIVNEGFDAFKVLVKSAKPVESDEVEFVTQRLSEVEPEEVDWLWENRIVRNKLNEIIGDAGVGKTWTVLDMLSRITRGQDFPDGAPGVSGEVYFVTAEDGIEDTIRPRAELLGADLSRFHILKLVIEKGKESFLDLDKHLGVLNSWLANHPDVIAMGLDPLSSFLGKVDSHRNSEVRALLGRLARVAEQRKVGIIAIDHLSKGQGRAVHRGIGSIAFTAAPRAVWQVVLDPDDAERRLMLPVKMNLTKVDGLAFRLTDDGIEWEKDAVTISADDAARETGDTPRNEAKAWLRDKLVKGPVPAKDIERDSKDDGICMRTLIYAKKELSVESKRHKSMWSWGFPKQFEKAKTKKTVTQEDIQKLIKKKNASKGVKT